MNFHAVSAAERALDTLNYSSIKGRARRVMWSHRDPSLRKSDVGNVVVKNLDRNIDNKALYDIFRLFQVSRSGTAVIDVTDVRPFQAE